MQKVFQQSQQSFIFNGRCVDHVKQQNTTSIFAKDSFWIRRLAFGTSQSQENWMAISLNNLKSDPNLPPKITLFASLKAL